MYTSSFKSFAKQNRSALYCFLLSGIFFFLASLDMQAYPSGKLICISPFVGSEIDPDEYFRYRFHEIEPVRKREFLSAKVFQLKANLFLLQIELKGGKERIKSFKPDVLALFHMNVQRYGKKMHRAFDRLESEIKQGLCPFVRIELTNEIVLLGQVIKLSANTLSFKSKIGVFSFPLETIEKIEFEELMDSRGALTYAKR